MRISRGLPFNACVNARACTSLRPTFGNLTYTQELYQGVAPPGLTYLTYRRRVEQGEEDNEAQAKNVAMHLCVCLITLVLPLIICKLSDSSLYRVPWRALCVGQTERAHLQFIPDSLNSYSYFSNS